MFRFMVLTTLAFEPLHPPRASRYCFKTRVFLLFCIWRRFSLSWLVAGLGDANSATLRVAGSQPSTLGSFGGAFTEHQVDRYFLGLQPGAKYIHV